MKFTFTTIRISLFALVVMVMSAGTALAGGPVKTENAGAKLQEQVQEMVEVTPSNASFNGKAVVTFKVTDHNRINVVKVISDNPTLKNHVEKAMNGKHVREFGLVHNQYISFNLVFSDLE